MRRHIRPNGRTTGLAARAAGKPRRIMQQGQLVSRFDEPPLSTDVICSTLSEPQRLLLTIGINETFALTLDLRSKRQNKDQNVITRFLRILHRVFPETAHRSRSDTF